MLVCRDAGCLREALAVASARLLPLDPAALQLRQQYVATITPTAAAGPSAAAGNHTDSPTVAVPAAAVQRHPEAAAANLLLLDQPATAARVLASKDGGSNAAAVGAAARVAALAVANKVRQLRQCPFGSQNAWSESILAVCLMRGVHHQPTIVHCTALHQPSHCS